jgi:hypothetical protein
MEVGKANNPYKFLAHMRLRYESVLIKNWERRYNYGRWNSRQILL